MNNLMLTFKQLRIYRSATPFPCRWLWHSWNHSLVQGQCLQS